jgi:aminopeptidase N
MDLSQMDRWYSQAGTPIVTVQDTYDSEQKQLTLTISQHTPSTPGIHQSEAEKQPVIIPLLTGLLDPSTGEEILPTQSLVLKQKTETFILDNIRVKPVISTLRSFSAPVKLEIHQSEADLITMMAHDTDAFNQWDAGNRLFTSLIMRYTAMSTSSLIQEQSLPPAFLEAIGTILRQALSSVDTLLSSSSSPSSSTGKKDLSLIAYALSIPDETTLLTLLSPPIDIDALHIARRHVKQQIAIRYQSEFRQLYDKLFRDTPFVFSTEVYYTIFYILYNILLSVCLHLTRYIFL